MKEYINIAIKKVGVYTSRMILKITADKIEVNLTCEYICKKSWRRFGTSGALGSEGNVVIVTQWGITGKQ